MKKNYKVVVAHPDDEVIFFSSVLKSSSKTIICFNESEDKIVNEGREKIKNQVCLFTSDDQALCTNQPNSCWVRRERMLFEKRKLSSGLF